MSVIIHGLNIPKSCDECRLFNESWCMALGVENWRKSYNKPPEGGRLPDCPLVPLPEGHGRLIDADALERIIGGFSLNWEYGQGVSDCWDALISAPTILEAEGDGKDGAAPKK